MERKDFIKKMGLATGVAALGSLCFNGCNKDDNGSKNNRQGPISPFTIDMSTTPYASLKTNGSYVSVNNVIVAKTLQGKYIAVQKSCTHEVYPLTYQASKNRFFCKNHDAIFTESGKVTSGPTSTNLTTYSVSQSGDILSIS